MSMRQKRRSMSASASSSNGNQNISDSNSRESITGRKRRGSEVYRIQGFYNYILITFLNESARFDDIHLIAICHQSAKRLISEYQRFPHSLLFFLFLSLILSFFAAQFVRKRH